MRMLSLVLALCSCSPGDKPATCTPGSCAAGSHCVFRETTTQAQCTSQCLDDGGCTSGSCACRPYPNGGSKCVSVCQ